MKYGKDELARSLHTKWAGQAIHFYENIDSTNLEASRLAADAAHGTLVVADKQTAGRGRRGRAWESPAGANIYFSLLLKPDMSAEKASMLTLVMALAVLSGVKSCVNERNGHKRFGGMMSAHAKCMVQGTSEVQLGIKWPNDIVLNGKKLCGILTEAKLFGTELEHVVIGVGINVGKQEFREELVDKATSLEQECGYAPDRTMLLAKIMEAFEDYYERFEQDGNLAGLQEVYNTWLINRDREVRVLDPKGEFTGIARGINELGELMVECADGNVTAVYAGEVSVRGIYGYI